MKAPSIHLGKVFNIPINLDYSWFLIFLLLTWTLAVGYFPQEFKGWPAIEYWVLGAVTAILLFVSVLLHELGHSVVALRYKVPVQKITLFLFGGIAQIGAEPPSAAAEFWIAIAGPAVSFALAAMFGLLTLASSGITQLLALAKYLMLINGSLGLFNLIPGFPLDGGRILRSIVWALSGNYRRATLLAANLGRLVALGFIVYGVWQMLNGNLANGLWIAFIGWFLESAANSQVQQQTFHDLLAGHTVAQAMSRDFAVVSPQLSLQQITENKIFGEGRRFFVVKDGERAVGLLTLHNLRSVMPAQWDKASVSDCMLPLASIQRLSPDMPLEEAIRKMGQDGVNQLPVIQDGAVVGMLTRESLINFFRTLHELGHIPGMGTRPPLKPVPK